MIVASLTRKGFIAGDTSTVMSPRQFYIKLTIPNILILICV